ncbi:carbohydrate ABC transporter membrane protein 1, CUT1 family [Streptosporangium subroseum]|uniref:Carbohydrate ABC transporter membrane protein 1, CUT1 family n=1 Tax=Streptosporangium subroseum TaxID=106412 RepID=A0A239FZU9_9ACTN|nr:sugar ABC transporter permease [Streptosporangium subroseum]SNS61988.1 carbohydrate ABC transporter membrane protein 1, CUT1 family [Streptosporangium subroseum]
MTTTLPSGPTPRQGPGRRSGTLTAWLFLAPALLLFLYFKFIPMFEGLRMSFFEVRPYLGDEWVGTDNYRTILSDGAFVSAMWHSTALALGTTVGSLVLGLLLALLIEGKARYLWFVRTAAFLPVVTTMAAVAEVWRIMYHPGDTGMLNTIIGWLGIGPQPFLASEDSSLLSIMGMGIWRGTPYDMMIFLAGLVGVDRTLYEAAAVDGASTWRRLRHVTLPALRPVFWILFTLAAIRGLRVFVEVYVLTNGGPNGSSEVLMTLIYKLGLQRGDLGVAAAGSIVLFVATLLLTLLVQFLRRRQPK